MAASALAAATVRRQSGRLLDLDGRCVQAVLRRAALRPRLEAAGIVARESCAYGVLTRSSGAASVLRSMILTCPWRAGPCQSAGWPTGARGGPQGKRKGLQVRYTQVM